MTEKWRMFFCFMLSVFFLLSLLYSQPQGHRFERIVNSQGLRSNKVYSIVMDSQGFLWLSTGFGLYRYDGNIFKQYGNDANESFTYLGDNLSGHLFIDDADNLWIGTKNNGLSIINCITESVVHFSHDTSDATSISHNNVYKVFQDEEGAVWVGTLGGGLNKFIPSDKSFVSFTPEPDSSGYRASHIYAIVNYSRKQLMVGTSKGLYLFNKESGKFSCWNHHAALNRFLKQDVIVDILIQNHFLWIATENGLVRYDSLERKITRFLAEENKPSTLSNNLIRHMIPSRDNQDLWISTAWGLNRFDTETLIHSQFLYDKNDPGSLGYNMLWYLYLDNANILWIGTDNAGLNVLDLNDSPFRHYRVGDNSHFENQYTATAFCEDHKNQIWIGTFDGGLWKFDPLSLSIEKFWSHTGEADPFSKCSIFSIFIDPEKAIWVGTSTGTLYKIEEGVCRSYEIHSGDQVQHKASILEVIKDRSGALWVGTISGLLYSDAVSGSFEYFADESLRNSTIRAISEDAYGNLWVGTDGEGLFKISRNVKDELLVKNYKHEPKREGTIESNTVMSVYEDDSGVVWIATKSGLSRYNPMTDGFESIIRQELANEHLYHIQGDKKGRLWLTSSGGLIRYDPPSGIFKLYDFERDVSLEDIYPFSFYLSRAGEIFVGGKYGHANGFYDLNPDKLKDNLRIPPVVITDFKIRNEPYYTDSAINFKKNIKLNYNQNYFSFEFAALDYTDPSKNQFAYQLEGFDEDWTYCGNRRFANYTGVPPGDYLFKVKGSNNDGYWNETGARLGLRIPEPPWWTWWSKSLYVVFILSVLAGVVWYYLKRQQLRYALEMEHLQKEKLAELDRMKSRFFANISHEFRTPLTLILGPIEKLISKTKDDVDLDDLRLMKRNARRLQRLIDQLLSLSKLEAGQMKLHASEVNLHDFVKGYFQSFESAARHKNIEMVLRSENRDISIFIDQDKIEKVLYNLLSNAMKYTPEGGRIEVLVSGRRSAVSSPMNHAVIENTADRRLPTAELSGHSVIISITNTGPGIPPEHLPHIFDRFYRADDSDARFQEGSGIGLALAKEMMELHHGKIEVESAGGKGTTFKIILPLGREHLSDEEVDTSRQSLVVSRQPEDGLEVLNRVSTTDYRHTGVKTPLLLIVEDNHDMRYYIRSVTDGSYRITEAKDGHQGWEMALKQIPDLVISDIMMPGMDGYELCRRIKSDERTCHIPVILLTARAAMEDKLEGLETGADEFISKPFQPEELVTRIKNLITQRLLLREKYRKEFEHISLIPENSMSSYDAKFMEKVRKVVGEHIADPDFDIQRFSREMNMSRAQLHRKLSALFNLSATAFIRTFRLNTAARLLESGTGNIAQVAYQVGFNNLSYFSKCFQKQFGVNPSAYLSLTPFTPRPPIPPLQNGEGARG